MCYEWYRYMHDFTKIAGAIVDMDGTILDSTEAWDACAPALLQQWGYTPKPSLEEDVYPLGTLDIAEFLKADYCMTQSVEEIYEAVIARMEHYYYAEAQLKPGAKELLLYLKSRGVKLTLATATVRTCVLPALKLTGVAELFDHVLTCDEIGHTKREPHIFLEAMKRMGTTAETTWLFEDALYSVCTAKELGLIICGVADSSAAFQKADMLCQCDFFLEEMTQWRELPFVDPQVRRSSVCNGCRA